MEIFRDRPKVSCSMREIDMTSICSWVMRSIVCVSRESSRKYFIDKGNGRALYGTSKVVYPMRVDMRCPNSEVCVEEMKKLLSTLSLR